MNQRVSEIWKERKQAEEAESLRVSKLNSEEQLMYNLKLSGFLY